MQQRCFKFVSPQLGCAFQLLSVHSSIFFSEHILRFDLILLTTWSTKRNLVVSMGYIYWHTMLWLRSILSLRQYSAWGVYMNSSYGNVPVYMLMRKFWVSRLAVEASTMSVARRVVFGSFPPKTASPSKEMNSVFFTFTLSWNCFLTLLHRRLMTLDTCTLSHARHLEDENVRKWQVQAWNPPAHATDTLVNSRKPGRASQTSDKCPKNATKTPVAVFITTEVFTRINNASKIGVLDMF